MIAIHRATLVKILGAPLLDELDRVFNAQPGPTLRHDVAHGQLTDGECYSAHAIYACWLLYRVCCLSVMGKMGGLGPAGPRSGGARPLNLKAAGQWAAPNVLSPEFIRL